MDTIIVKMAVVAIFTLLNIAPASKPFPEPGVSVPPPIAEIQPIDKTKSDIKPLEPLPEVKTPIVTPKPATTPKSPQNGSGWHYPPCGVGSFNKRAEIRAYVESKGLPWSYIDFIFGKESSHDPYCMNSGGCKGLGQACPGSKLPCQAGDIPCQVDFFNRYAQGKGGWSASYNFWLANHWW